MPFDKVLKNVRPAQRGVESCTDVLNNDNAKTQHKTAGNKAIGLIISERLIPNKKQEKAKPTNALAIIVSERK